MGGTTGGAEGRKEDGRKEGVLVECRGVKRVERVESVRGSWSCEGGGGIRGRKQGEAAAGEGERDEEGVGRKAMKGDRCCAGAEQSSEGAPPPISTSLAHELSRVFQLHQVAVFSKPEPECEGELQIPLPSAMPSFLLLF